MAHQPRPAAAKRLAWLDALRGIAARFGLDVIELQLAAAGPHDVISPRCHLAFTDKKDSGTPFPSVDALITTLEGAIDEMGVASQEIRAGQRGRQAPLMAI